MGATDQLHAWVQGKVQGVGFRYYVRQRATELPITGWVRNLSDGRVELLAEGSRPDLEALLAAVRQGPRDSQVSDVRVEWGGAGGQMRGFAVKPNASP
jgi:acylphosphatase